MAWKLLLQIQATEESGRSTCEAARADDWRQTLSFVNMKSSTITTLFSEQPRPSAGPSAIAVSLTVHTLAAGGLLLALKQTPHISDPKITHVAVRLVKAQRIELAALRAGSSELTGQTEPLRQVSSHDAAPGSGASALPTFARLPQLLQRSQTLVQPDAPTEQMLTPETPIPLVVLWSPDNTPSKIIVAHPHQEQTIAETRPAMIKPNLEPELSDLNITRTPFPSQTPLPPPSSTSPIVVRGQQVIKQIPSTSTAQLETPTLTQVLSLSPLQAEGAVVVPFANQISQLGTTALSASTGKGSGNSIAASNQAGNGAGSRVGSGSATGANTTSFAGSGGQTGGGAVAGQSGTGSAPAFDGEDAGLIAGGEITASHIVQPKDGQFGVVIVGSAVSEQYPEMTGFWSDRLVYTVYLHVGLRKNWILQYSVLRTGDAATNGNNSRPEAPWPYDILRPKINPTDYNTDAIMVHGFVNPVGRFERLALVLPNGFPEAKFVLNSLQQWQFRPARQNGHNAAVEVLLIIPEEGE